MQHKMIGNSRCRALLGRHCCAVDQHPAASASTPIRRPKPRAWTVTPGACTKSANNSAVGTKRYMDPPNIDLYIARLSGLHTLQILCSLYIQSISTGDIRDLHNVGISFRTMPTQQSLPHRGAPSHRRWQLGMAQTISGPFA
jgi:hypothetical protein